MFPFKLFRNEGQYNFPTILLSIALILAIGLSIFLWFKWQSLESSIQTGVEAIANLNQVNHDFEANIANSKNDLADLQGNIDLLNLELGQLTDNKNELQTKADLYQSQKVYLSDVLDWYNQYYFFQQPKRAHRKVRGCHRKYRTVDLVINQ